MLDKLLIGVIAAPLVLLVIRGIWRATAPQEGGGCPYCQGNHDASSHEGEADGKTHDHHHHG